MLCTRYQPNQYVVPGNRIGLVVHCAPRRQQQFVACQTFVGDIECRQGIVG